MNQAEHKAEAERIMAYARDSGPVYSDTYKNTIARAQVHATLATIPDLPSHGLGPL